MIAATEASPTKDQKTISISELDNGDIGELPDKGFLKIVTRLFETMSK